jgi:hypothetical protein
MEDLEELMYMEAIRLSLASAEEERKKQEKEEAKKAKKEEKQRSKDAKKAAKDARRRGSSAGLYSASINESQGSGLGGEAISSTSGAAVVGKGKQPASSTPSPEPASSSSSKTPKDNPQAFLEQSRANINSAPVPVPTPTTHRQALRHLSSTSSVSSLNDSQDPSPNASGLALDDGVTPPSSGPYSETPPSTEPMFNFRSLAAVIGDEEAGEEGGEGTKPIIEHLESVSPSPGSSSPPKTITPPERPLSAGERLFGSISPPASPKFENSVLGVGVGVPENKRRGSSGDGGVLTPQESNPYDAKHYGDISILDGMETGGRFGSAR